MINRCGRVLGLGLLLLVGCGGPARYPVEGRVAFPDGTAVTDGVVEFRYEEGEPLRPTPSAQIQPDGNYRVELPAGKYKLAVIVPPVGGMNMDGPPPQPVIAERFKKYETSGLELTVKPEKNDFPIPVTRP
jgi:hypothetical protein